MTVRRAEDRDEDAIWQILEPVIRAGETSRATPHEVFAAEDSGDILDAFYLDANQLGGRAYMGNCGYMTAPWTSGRGIVRRVPALDQAGEGALVPA